MATLSKRLATLDALHVVPGDAKNKLVEDIVDSKLISYGVLAIYNSDKSMKARCSSLNIPFESLGFERKQLLKQFFAIFLHVLEVKPKSIFLHSFYPSIFGIGLSLLVPFTKVVSVRHHNMVHLLSNNRKGVFLDRVVAKTCDHSVAVSFAVERTLIAQGCDPQKISVIHNGIRISKSDTRGIPLKVAHQPLRLLAIGRLDWQKNYETLLRVAARLMILDIDFRLSILGVGNAEYSRTLFEMTEDLGLGDRISWLGWTTDVNSWFFDSDIFVHTALDEACPLVLIEALLSGIPIVSSIAGGSSEVIQGFATGCAPTDVDAFVNAILSTLGDFYEAVHSAQSQIPLVEEKFGVEQMRIGYESFTSSILSKNSS